MENNFTYSYKQMQEMLPDFVFDNLTLDEREIFLRTLPLYPDLQQEIVDVREVFGKVEEMEFDTEIDQRTRNISYRVQSKIKQSKMQKFNSGFIKYALPLVAVCITIMMFINRGNNLPIQNQIIANESTPQREEEIEIFTKADSLMLFDDGITAQEYLTSLNSTEPSLDLITEKDLEGSSETLEQMTTNYLSENVVNDKVINDLGNYSNSSIYEELKELDENDLQNILQELGNEKSPI